MTWPPNDNFTFHAPQRVTRKVQKPCPPRDELRLVSRVLLLFIYPPKNMNRSDPRTIFVSRYGTVTTPRVENSFSQTRRNHRGPVRRIFGSISRTTRRRIMLFYACFRGQSRGGVVINNSALFG